MIGPFYKEDLLYKQCNEDPHRKVVELFQRLHHLGCRAVGGMALVQRPWSR